MAPPKRSKPKFRVDFGKNRKVLDEATKANRSAEKVLQAIRIQNEMIAKGAKPTARVPAHLIPKDVLERLARLKKEGKI